jgi:hypothetical protein
MISAGTLARGPIGTSRSCSGGLTTLVAVTFPDAGCANFFFGFHQATGRYCDRCRSAQFPSHRSGQTPRCVTDPDRRPLNQRSAEEAANLVIDAQRAYTVKGSELFCPDSAANLDRINRLIQSFESSREPIFLIRHVHRADGSDLGRMFDFSGAVGRKLQLPRLERKKWSMTRICFVQRPRLR